MDSHFHNVVENLNQNVTTENTNVIDIVQLELNLRKLDMELVLKRKQVNQLREEVDLQNQTNHDLRTQLMSANAKVATLESELKILKKSLDDLEDETQNRLRIDKKFQKEILEKESASFKELLQKSEMEKRKLQREIEDLNSQQVIHTSNMKDLLEQDQKIRLTIEKYSKSFEEVDKEKEKILELYNKLREFQKFNHQIASLSEKLQLYISKTKELDEKRMFSEAKLNMLEELLENYSLPQAEKPSKLREYYIERIEDLERHLNTERELIFQQQARLNKEVSTNISLCNSVADLEKKVADLERKLANININSKIEVVSADG